MISWLWLIPAFLIASGLGFFAAALMAVSSGADEQIYRDRCELLEDERTRRNEACICGAWTDAA